MKIVKNAAERLSLLIRRTSDYSSRIRHINSDHPHQLFDLIRELPNNNTPLLLTVNRSTDIHLFRTEPGEPLNVSGDKLYRLQASMFVEKV